LRSSPSRYDHLYRFVAVLALTALLAPAAAAAGSGFRPQLRVGFTLGDQWEPAIAADGYGHVYILYPQYGALPGCSACPLPTMVLVTSSDNGETFEAPRPIAPPSSGQYDPQITVDPIDHRTLYAAWLQNNKSDTVVAKSADFGQSWSLVIAARNDDTDKPVLAVRGADVYVAFSNEQEMRVAASHDGGITFASYQVALPLPSSSLAGGGTVDPAGNVYFAWSAYLRSRRKVTVHLYLSRSTDGGKTWNSSLMDTSAIPPDCTAYHCGWAYLGAQITVASDAAGTLYALWNSGDVDKGLERIYFASSTTAGTTWSPKTDISAAPSGAEHAFPAIAAGSAGDVRIAWMDSRNSPHWNTYYRSSTNGGATWSPESRLSTPTPSYTYIYRDGFGFPFGDYFEMDIDSRGQTQAVWGEGLNFKSPGSIWYSSGR
jgi:hypothetical protein